jgi:hypothetical protein
MTQSPEAVRDLVRRVESATGPSKALDREIALAVGWVRLSPSEARRSNPAWYHPEDCRNGKPIIDSLHGTDVWRDPIAYTASLDAAMSLVPEGWFWMAGNRDRITPRAYVENGEPSFVGISSRRNPNRLWFEVTAATPALALVAAALRARLQGQADE